MSVVVVGLEQHQVSLDLLERVAISREDTPKVLADLATRENLSEVVLLSTCLRTELYAVADLFHLAVNDLQMFLADRAGVALEAISEHTTVLFDDAVPPHLFEVASGLRSAVLGETEVLGQVRRAAEMATASRTSGPVLTSLFRHAVRTGRRVRSSTAIARGSTSLSHVAVELAAARTGGTLESKRLVVVGAGEIGEGVVDAIAGGPKPASLVVANRTASRGSALAARVGGIATSLGGLRSSLESADVAFVSTGSSLPLIDRDILGPVTESRTASGMAPLVVVDLSVPRNVDPAVGVLPGIDLLDMDDLRSHASLAVQGRLAEVAGAREIIWEEVETFRAQGRARSAAPVVSSLRGRLDDIRKAELERQRGQLGSDLLDDEQWLAVEEVTRSVLAKILHDPSMALKDTAGTPRGDRLVEAVRALFDLP